MAVAFSSLMALATGCSEIQGLGRSLMHGNAAVQAVGAWVAGLPFQQALKLKQTGMDGKTSLISVTIYYFTGNGSGTGIAGNGSGTGIYGITKNRQI